MPGETGMNNNSSQSHAAFTLTINQGFFYKNRLIYLLMSILYCFRLKKGSSSTITTKYHPVDLAGRASKTYAVGERLSEGVFYEGLLSLGIVMDSLCKRARVVYSIPTIRSYTLSSRFPWYVLGAV
jgi:hypothetical protein